MSQNSFSCLPTPHISTVQHSTPLWLCTGEVKHKLSQPTSDPKPKATSCGHPPTHPHCTTQEGLSHSLCVCVCVTVKLCRSVYGPWLGIPASLRVSDHTSLTISKLHKCQVWWIIGLPGIFAVLIYSSQTRHNAPFVGMYVSSYIPAKNTVFSSRKENKILTHIQEIPWIIFLTASHVSPVLLPRVFYHVCCKIHRLRKYI